MLCKIIKTGYVESGKKTITTARYGESTAYLMGLCFGKGDSFTKNNGQMQRIVWKWGTPVMVGQDFFTSLGFNPVNNLPHRKLCKC